jgi:AraC-like DNA-binding protein
MTMRSEILASGPGWLVRDVTCTAGPGDRAFEEQHDAMSIAAVTQGTFRYRAPQGTSLLAPGAVLLGNAGYCFECGHEHGVGDRCVSVHVTPGFWEAAIAATPGARRAMFAIPSLPPLRPLLAPIAALVAAGRDRDAAAIEELALRFVGAVATTLAGGRHATAAPSRRDAQRISDAVRRIEAEPAELAPAQRSLGTLAREAAMSPYHFLRVFRQVVGMTPHQFRLHTRLQRAAIRLRQSDETISTIAFDAGFNDLSTFNRRFRSIMGASPRAYRAGT